MGSCFHWGPTSVGSRIHWGPASIGVLHPLGSHICGVLHPLGPHIHWGPASIGVPHLWGPASIGVPHPLESPIHGGGDVRSGSSVAAAPSWGPTAPLTPPPPQTNPTEQRGDPLQSLRLHPGAAAEQPSPLRGAAGPGSAPDGQRGLKAAGERWGGLGGGLTIGTGSHSLIFPPPLNPIRWRS